MGKWIALTHILLAALLCNGQRETDGSQCTDGLARLVGGSADTAGILEICQDGMWTRVCRNHINIHEANIICRHLGFLPIGAELESSALYDSPPPTSRALTVACENTDRKFSDCVLTPLGSRGCSSTTALRCSPCLSFAGRNRELFYCPDGTVDEERVKCIYDGDYRCDGTIDCLGEEDEHYCDICSDTEGEGKLRLVDGDSLREGRLEICMNGRWGTVCSSGFDTTDAEVVCRQLGFPTSRAKIRRFGRGDSNSPVWLESVECTGSEETLSECSRADNVRCGHSQDIGIMCLPECTRDGDVRVVNGSGPHEGRVQVCYEERWGSVCDEGWDENEASVICRQLGYTSRGALAFQGEAFGVGDAILSQVECSGNEERVLECSHNAKDVNCNKTGYAAVSCAACTSNQYSCTLGAVNGSRCINSSKLCDGVIDCMGGEDEAGVRLVDGILPVQGRVEYCFNGEWQTVCDDRWDRNEARVVCRQLGYESPDPRSECCASFGQGPSQQPILRRIFNCNGREQNISQCSTSVGPICSHREDAAVICRCTSNTFPCRETSAENPVCITDLQFCDGIPDCPQGSDENDCALECSFNGEIRLVGGESPNEGRVEICYRGRWGSVCDNWWDYDDATVVCKQLGFGTLGAEAQLHSFFGRGEGTINLDNVRCHGSEGSLIECSRNQFGHAGFNCHDHQDDASVICPTVCPDNVFQCEYGRVDGQTPPCITHQQRCDGVSDCYGGEDEMEHNCFCSPNGAVRLVGGTVPYRGRAEYCVNGRWLSVCSNAWDQRKTTVVCRQLGYPTDGARAGAFGLYETPPSIQPVLRDSFSCRGSERNLSMCSRRPGSQCRPTGHVEVICSNSTQPFPCLSSAPDFESNVTELHFCDGKKDCSDNSDEPTSCAQACTEPGKVRLVLGEEVGENKGRVEICFGGMWGTICDDTWDYRDAQVVCRQLGFGSIGAIPLAKSTYNPGSGPLHLDNVICVGTEGNITECRKMDYGQASLDCRSHFKDASVVCPTICPDDMFQCYHGKIGVPGSPCISHSQRCDGMTDCIGGEDEFEYNCPCEPEGSVRLIDGIVPYRGRVEICQGSRWTSVCSSSLDDREAKVVCRQLGYPVQGAKRSCCDRGFRSGSDEQQPVLSDKFYCRGNERNLSECFISEGSLCNDHSQDVHVICRSPFDDFQCAGVPRGIPSNVTELQFCDGVSNCINGTDESEHCPSECQEPGKIRLVNNGLESITEGRVEICFGGRWGSICEHSWDNGEARVVCRQLGFASSGAISQPRLRYGSGLGPVHLNRVICSGSEGRITDCDIGIFGQVSSNCRSHLHDVSVVCSSVCPDSMLECFRGRVDDQETPCISSQQRCDGTIDCIGGEDEEDYNCPCEPDGSVRLVGNSLPYPFQGRVEYCAQGRWLKMCARLLDSNDARTICRQLGYPTEGAVAYSSERFQRGSELQLTLLDRLDCTGNENNVSECGVDPSSETSCSVDASITCGDDQQRFYCSNPPLSTPTNISLYQVCDGSRDCDDGTDESNICSMSECQTGSVRLIEDMRYEGRGMSGVLEICVAGRWRTMGCNSNWGYTEAQVTCRHLGYATAGASSARVSSYMRTSLAHSVSCQGNESNLFDCINNFAVESSTSCHVSVTCTSLCHEDTIECTNGRLDGKTPACISLQERCDGIADCIGGEDELPYNCPCNTEGEIRLAGSIVPQSGRVEMCTNKRWITTCTSSWGNIDASVACRQLGFSMDGSHRVRNQAGDPSQPVGLYTYVCSGRENILFECRKSTDFSCTSRFVAGVTCSCSSGTSSRRCLSELEVCDGRNDTLDGSDEGSNCHNECNRPGEVRLVDGGRTNGSRGRVEICFQGMWGTVCDSEWDDRDAQVVCRQLGYNSSGAKSQRGFFYGRGRGPVFLDRLRCSGTENNITECIRPGDILSTCGHASVECIISCSENETHCRDGRVNDRQSYCIPNHQRCDGINHCIQGEDEYCPNSCSPNGAVRLVDGRTPHEGRVEICSGGQWARKCERSRSITGSKVICRQLGYPTENVISRCCGSGYSAGFSIQPSIRDTFSCIGTEESITECIRVPVNGICTPNSDYIVICNCPDPKDIPCQVPNNNGSTTCISELKLCDGKTDCPQGTDEENCGTECTLPGAVRLVDSYGLTDVKEGRVEVCFNGEWGTVCDTNWDYGDAQVVCRQLGLGVADAIPRLRSYYGPGSGPVHMDNLGCQGTEDALVNCSRSAFKQISSSCMNDRRAASVACTTVCSEGTFECQQNRTHLQCIPDSKRCDGIKDCLGGVDELDHNCPCSPEGSVRLVDGIVPYRGRVEICVDNTWSTICSRSLWDNNDATVVCRQLGYDMGGETSRSESLFPRTINAKQPKLRDEFRCRGTESSLMDCPQRVGRGFDICDHRTDVAVICTTTDRKYPCNGHMNVTELQFCNNVTDCEDQSDEPPSCGAVCHKPGEVRLVDDHERTGGLRGRVEICFGGRWGVVCGKNWGYREAEVVCRQLGFASRGALGSTTHPYFDPASSRIHLDEVICQRTENHLSDCSSAPFGVERETGASCRSQPAAVTCQSVCPGNTTECQYGRKDGVVPPCISNDKLCDGVPDCIGGDDELDFNCPCTPEGAVRLVDGNAPHQGRLEFCNGGLWSTICSSRRWTRNEAAVVCRQLGYSTTGQVHRSFGTFGIRPDQQRREGDIIICRGNEVQLSDCIRSRSASCNDDIEVICSCPDPKTVPCIGSHLNSSLCISEFRFCDGVSDCSNGTDETAQCEGECTKPGEIRLTRDGNIGGNNGTVEICMRGQWGTICDENWSQTDAEVACRQLGFGSKGAVSYTRSHFGASNGPVHLSRFRCSGLERNLTECEEYSIIRNFSSTCQNHLHDASILCPTVCPDDQFMCSYGRQDGQQPACLTTDKLCDGVRDCSEGEDELDYNCPCSPDGAVRLVDGILPHQGRLEFCRNNRWTTSCTTDSTNPRLAVAVCSQLGFPTEDASIIRNWPGPEGQSLFNGAFRCTPNALSINECELVEQSTCGHERDIGVACDCPGENQFPCKNSQGNITCVSILQYCDGTPDCADGSDEPSDCLNECSRPGQLRLVNGADTTGHEGRLEICFKGQWGSVCQDNWNYFDTEVACRQLGLGTIEAVSYTQSRYGRGLGPVFLNNLRCSGAENMLYECPRSRFGPNVFTCNDHSRDISISCGKCPDISMFECKSGRRDEENPPCISREQRCDNVTDCLEGEDELPHNCPCSPEGAVRLVGGSGPHEGRVEFCWKTVWVTICARFSWGRTNAGVVCHQLGYPRQGAQAQRCCSNFGSGPTTQPVYPPDIISCNGREEELSECNENLSTQCSSHFDDIGVVCRVE